VNILLCACGLAQIAIGIPIFALPRLFGSWPSVGVWGSYGGKVYATAMLTMALQAPFRTTRWR